PDKRPECRIEHRAVAIVSIGIRPVEDDDGNVMLCRSLHNVVERGYIGIKPNPDVLDIENEQPDSFQVSRGRLPLVPGQRAYRKTGTDIQSVPDMGSGIRLAPQSVLGGEEFGHLHTSAE